ncbi:MAG: aminotransferase class V-fold PLP-dependent enzyme [Hyphomicrobiales bacterium]
MENHFKKFRENTIGWDKEFVTPYGKKKMIYGDWIASGRLYKPIEDKIANTFGPWVANTHTETSETGTLMTKAYHYAQHLIKKHVNANENDVLVTDGSGMTGVVNKFQRILGLKSCRHLYNKPCIKDTEKPVIFITHMEHHSNHTSWLETNADVVMVKPGKGLLVDPDELRKELSKYSHRKLKFGSFTACSNVTGIETPYYELAKIMHEFGGYIFVDFAASAPYVDIDMHPNNPKERLDAVFFSPHKFLGGPGTSGVLVFNRGMYSNPSPDHPGGGTVDWTNAWGEFKYVDDIEAREDGGTPGFMQAIRTALCVKLKEQMGTDNIRAREHELVKKAFEEFRKIEKVHILADNVEDRLGVFSFYVEQIHFNLLVKLLNDKFGVQVRGGCACAGTYGHYLLEVSREQSRHITDLINQGNLTEKPGWVRLSLHPTMTNEELDTVVDAVKDIVANIEEYREDYIYLPKKNEFRHKDEPEDKTELIKDWFAFE